jgi:hypothetical protein
MLLATFICRAGIQSSRTLYDIRLVGADRPGVALNYHLGGDEIEKRTGSGFWMINNLTIFKMEIGQTEGKRQVVRQAEV